MPPPPYPTAWRFNLFEGMAQTQPQYFYMDFPPIGDKFTVESMYSHEAMNAYVAECVGELLGEKDVKWESLASDSAIASPAAPEGVTQRSSQMNQGKA